MSQAVFRVTEPREYQSAGPTDLVELLPAPGCNAIFVVKWLLETLVSSIVSGEFVHLSGPTGTAKSSLVEALYLAPANFSAVTDALGHARRPLRLFPVEMATYEAPGELYQRRALRDGATYDERSGLVRALEDAAGARDGAYPLVWLREMGRVHSATVQGGLLDLMTRGEIILPDGGHINGSGIAWIADSNYQAEEESTHVLVTFDDALRRRFTVNLTLGYLSPEQEVQILEHILAGTAPAPDAQKALIQSAVKLGTVIRGHRAEGRLLSVPPPTIYGYLAFLRLAQALAHLSPQQVAAVTLLGNASDEDAKVAAGVLTEVFGLQANAAEAGDLDVNIF
jgi:MoxR-like ATPase